MEYTKKEELEALETALQYLKKANKDGIFGLCNIIPTFGIPSNQISSKIIVNLMRQRSKSVKTFYNYADRVTLKKNQFQWKPNDRRSRVRWLNKRIKELKKELKN